MWLFDQAGLYGAFRIAHVFFAVMWMGLLWFFNYVQTPAYNEMGGPAKNEAFDKLTWRALWWFRYAAMMTVASGLLIIGIASSGDLKVYTGDFWKSASGAVLSTSILFALIMAYNVFMVIWPNQRIVITNARNVLAGQEADPAAAGAARKAAMASRQNSIFSWSVFFFMVGTSHFFNSSHWAVDVGGTAAVWWIVVLVLTVALELNALGLLGGTGTGGTRIIYDTHKNAIYASAGLMVLLYVLAEITLRA